MMTNGGDDFDKATTVAPCFCNPWKNKAVAIDAHDHTDADLAADMNALSFLERQAMEADIHGVSDIIKETPEFVQDNIVQMQQALATLNGRQRQAWDRAVFLRPALANDQELHLMCLRARRFRPHDAAVLLAAYFRSKLDLFGDDLLIHRITWNDLTEHEHKIFRSGAYQFLPKNDRTGRVVSITRICHWDLSDYKALARCIWYTDSIANDDPNMQRRGVVNIVDCADAWKFSAVKIFHFMTQYPTDSTPFHHISMHILYNDTTLDTMIRRFRRILLDDYRMRVRLHYGSTLETEYSLRTFGLDVAGQLPAHVKPKTHEVYDGIEESIRTRQRLDEECRQREAPHRDPGSPIALFPNPQDVIMGRNKVVSATWSGNILYNKVIQQYADRYVRLQSGVTDRVEKTMISLEILHLFRSQYHARFLTRNDDSWTVVDDVDGQKKISHALRNLARCRRTTPVSES